MMREIAEHILLEQGKGHDAVLVTIVDSKGSTPRHIGSQMLVDRDGLVCGTIGGGMVEAHGIAQARALVGQAVCRHETVGLKPKGEKSLGMVCGGEASLLYTSIEASDTSWGAVATGLLSCLNERRSGYLALACREGEEPFGTGFALMGADAEVLAGRGLDAGKVAAACATSSARGDSGTQGDAGSESDPAAEATQVGVRAAGRSSSKQQPACRVDGLFVMPINLPVRAIVFGGGHVGHAVIAALSAVGFDCTLFECRPEFAQPSMHPDARRIIVGDYQDIRASLDLEADDYVLIMTHSHTSDFAVLEQVLRQPLAYVGLMASRRKIGVARDLMLKAGISQEAFDQAHTPIGLDIKAETPAEIAVSVAAELILHRAERGNTA